MGEDVRKTWQESDLVRAIRAAEKAGLQSYRIETTPDGIISIVVGPSVEAGALPDAGALSAKL